MTEEEIPQGQKEKKTPEGAGKKQGFYDNNNQLVKSVYSERD